MRYVYNGWTFCASYDFVIDIAYFDDTLLQSRSYQVPSHHPTFPTSYKAAVRTPAWLPPPPPHKNPPYPLPSLPPPRSSPPPHPSRIPPHLPSPNQRPTYISHSTRILVAKATR
ncbi:hypothetical protein P152DRAFT_287298 [Eremomyces bilateralis CBS 781.70]|uniref:Uncharacterized protein n=1 Tax=Eremomyces bilateralis CBS 781.70 TaxID=1392243 RepID=A0A6G1G6J1_9PEZI|nr:uncharacterized protein P152DRAFT_287298 [Eremomyces bilateralis CBS 781.70]KAF1813644.1 hypothetical protein P152DRAFT_287298 [Eremomyces bilateralis CBS 781.70]